MTDEIADNNVLYNIIIQFIKDRIGGVFWFLSITAESKLYSRTGLRLFNVQRQIFHVYA